MKPIPINLHSKNGNAINNIRVGQMFQVESGMFGCFKSQAYRNDRTQELFFRKADQFIHWTFVDTLFYLDSLRK